MMAIVQALKLRRRSASAGYKMETYKIIRFHFDSENETIKTGLTLEEAQEHCRAFSPHGDGWFDGYESE